MIEDNDIDDILPDERWLKLFQQLFDHRVDIFHLAFASNAACGSGRKGRQNAQAGICLFGWLVGWFLLFSQN